MKITGPRRASVVLCGVALLLLANPVGSWAADDCVVIVNKANPADSISAGDLKKMFTGEKASWPNGAKVAAATPGADKPEYGATIKKTTGMSGADFKRYFIQLSFLGKVVPPPKAFDSTAAVAHFVGATPGGISCVPAADVVPTVKAIKVE